MNYSYLKPPKMPGYCTLANNLGFFWTSSSAWAIYLKISKTKRNKDDLKKISIPSTDSLNITLKQTPIQVIDARLQEEKKAYP